MSNSHNDHRLYTAVRLAQRWLLGHQLVRLQGMNETAVANLKGQMDNIANLLCEKFLEEAALVDQLRPQATHGIDDLRRIVHTISLYCKVLGTDPKAGALVKQLRNHQSAANSLLVARIDAERRDTGDPRPESVVIKLNPVHLGAKAAAAKQDTQNGTRPGDPSPL